MKPLAETLRALLSIADDPNDADDLRLRKRMGVAAGYLTILAPLGMPAAAGGMPLAWIVAAGFSVWSAANLVVLALTKRYERFVLGLLIFGLPFTLFSNIFVGGVTTGSGGLIWAFLGPAYALLALGPRRSMPGSLASWRPSSSPWLSIHSSGRRSRRRRMRSSSSSTSRTSSYR